MTALEQEEWFRYKQQMIIPGIGKSGQKKMKRARVFIAGIGGLGSVSACYMAAAGIGHIRIADKAYVEFENLNRQILHHTQDIGKSKTKSALKKLTALNPFCRIRAYNENIQVDNVIDLVSDSDLILDGSDSLETKKVLNRASIELDIPFIYGETNGFNGTVATFIPGKTPCFECLFHCFAEKNPSTGIIGASSALVGSIQSLEAIKIILNIKGLLTNQLAFIQGVNMTIKKIKVAKNNNCLVCGRKADKKKHAKPIRVHHTIRKVRPNRIFKTHFGG